MIIFNTTRVSLFKIIICCCLCWGQSLVLQAQDTDRATVMAILDRQQAAWNRGDLEAFMADYLHADSLLFIGGGTLSQGWQAALARYQKSYPDSAAMGRLSFKIDKAQLLSPEWYNLVGKWQLDRKSGTVKGSFTLLLRKIKGRWWIVQDHSS